MKNLNLLFLAAAVPAISFSSFSTLFAAQETYKISGVDSMNAQSVESAIQNMKNIESARVDIKRNELTVVSRTGEAPLAQDLQREAKIWGVSISSKSKPAAGR